MVYICPVCTNKFQSSDKGRRTCSKKCFYTFLSRQITKPCDYCGKDITRRAGHFTGYANVFCDRKCRYEWEKIKKQKFSQLRDKEWCIEQYKTKSLLEIAQLLNCGETIVYKFFKIHGLQLDRKQRLRAEKHHLWKGGITKLAHAIRTCSNNLNWKKAIWESNPHICVTCGSTENLEIDHIKKFKFILIDNNIKTLDDARRCKELWDVKNGRILCKKCNSVDTRLNYINK